MSHKYEKVTTYTKQPDGSVMITARSYREELDVEIKDIEKPYQNLTPEEARRVLEKALERITDNTSPLVEIVIKKNKQGNIKILDKHRIIG